MTLCDAGPLFALVDVRQKTAHSRCRAVLPTLSAPLVTTWPCFTEAMYLAYKAGGWPMQQLLWRYISEKALMLHHLEETEQKRMCELMEQYQDIPMDLADASLVAIAEALNQRSIFTLDSDFYVYRLFSTQPFEVVPA